MQGLSKFSFILICILIFKISGAQQRSYIRYTSEDGLPSNVTYSLIQDQKGYIWIGTDKGLSRFDGSTFKNYNTNNNLSGHEILHMHEDAENRIWAKSYNQIPSFLVDGQVFGKSNYPLLNKIRTSTNTRSIIHRRDSVWISSPDSLYLFTNSTVKSFSLGTENLPPIEKWTLKILKIEPNGELIFSNFTGMLKFANDSLQYTMRWPLNTNCYFYKDQFYLPGRDGISKFHDNAIVPLCSYDSLLIGKTKRFIYQGGYFWVIGTEKGVYQLDLTQKTCGATPYLKNFRISDAIQDRDGNYWFTTLSDGLIFLPSSEVQSYIPRRGIRKELSTILISKRHGMLVGSNIDGTIYQVDSTLKMRAFNSVYCKQFDGKRISSLYEFDTAVWIGTTGCGLFSVNSKTSLAKKVVQAGIRLKKILRLDNQVFLIFPKEIMVYDLQQNTKRSSQVGQSIQAATMNSAGKLFLGTNSGIYYLEENTLIPFRSDDTKLQDRINKLEFTERGYLAVGTATKGLVLIKGGKSYSYKTSEGLADNFCTALFCQEDTIWYGSNSGLNKIVINNLGTQRIIKYDKSNGLISNKINSIALYSGKLWISTDKGLCSFRSTYEPLSTPVLIIDSVEASGKLYEPSKLIELNNSQNNITFNFRAIYYGNSNDITYEYKLMGRETKWRTTKKKGVSYYDLPPGEYSVKIRINLDGNPTMSEPKILYFTIGAPFWQNPWFIALAPFIVLAVFFLVIRVTIHLVRSNEQRKFAIKERIARSELTALQSQINPHFIFNALHSIDTYIQNSQSQDASNYLKKFAKLMRLVLQSSTSNFIGVEEEVELLNYYLELEKLRFGDKFSYSIEYDQRLIDDEEKIPSMLIQPLVENAIKHAFNGVSNGMLSIHFGISGPNIVTTIEDNGIGIERSKKKNNTSLNRHKSMGLANVIDRINVLDEAGIENISLNIIDLQTINRDGTRIELSWQKQEE